MKKFTSQLEHLGLSHQEASTYIALLNMGKGTILDIAKRTGISRSTLYSIIDSLIEKQFISESVQGKRKIFVAEHPERIQHVFKEHLRQFNSLLPELISLANVSTKKPNIEYLEGIAGVKQAFLDCTESESRKIIAFVGIDHLLSRSRALESFWYGEFRKRKEKNEIFSQLILPDTKEGKAFKAKDAENFRESRFVPESTYNFPAEILVYDNTVVFFSYNTKEEFALKVTSEPIAETVKMVFKMTWNLSY